MQPTCEVICSSESIGCLVAQTAQVIAWPAALVGLALAVAFLGAALAKRASGN